jgi:hypothetical protein
MLFYYSDFNSLCDRDTDRSYLDRFFDQRCLIITDSNLNWVDLEQVRAIVTDNDIELILVDLTHNPYPDADPGRRTTPHALQQQYSTIATTQVLTSDYRYYYDPDPDFIFFPLFLWLFGTRQPAWYAQVTYDAGLEKSSSIMCLNSTQSWHRIYLFGQLIECSSFDHVDYSFVFPLGDVLEQLPIPEYMTAAERNHVRQYQDRLPIRLANDGVAQKNDVGVGHSVYNQCAINLVTETSITEGVMLSEKTCKPFMAYQIPIMVGPIGGSQFLEDIGLDMFADYIPWTTWDSVADHKLRIRMIVEFVNSLLADPEEILTTHHDFKARLIKNKKYFHSTEFQDRLLQQILSARSV